MTMFKKPVGIKTANRPLVDDEGFTTFTILESEVCEMIFKNTVGKHTEETADIRYKLVAEFAGKTGEMRTTILTGVTLNAEPLSVKYKGRKTEQRIYNRFTTTMLAFDLINERELQSDEDFAERLEIDITALVGKTFKAVLVRDEKGFWQIDLATVVLGA